MWHRTGDQLGPQAGTDRCLIYYLKHGWIIVAL